MSMAEWFLLIWAMCATFMAVRNQYYFQRARRASYIAHMMLVGLSKGTAKMEKVGNTAVFINSDEDSESEIRIQTR